MEIMKIRKRQTKEQKKYINKNLKLFKKRRNTSAILIPYFL